MKNEIEILFPIFGDFSICPSRYIQLGGIRIYWYGVIIAVGFILAAIYAMRRAKEFGLTQDNLLDTIICSVPAGIIGGRIYYVIFNWAEYRTDLTEIFKIWHGGLGIYGAVIFGVLAAIIYFRVRRMPITPILDIGSLGLLIGQAVGRWANFINREAYGVETKLPWKMGLRTTYSTGTIYTTFVHPTFLYESVWNLVGFLFLHWYSKKHRRYDGQIFAMYVAWYGFGRMIIEGLRSDSLYLFNTDLRVSQLVALISCFIALVFLIMNRLSVVHRPEDMLVNKVAVGSEIEETDDAPEIFHAEQNVEDETNTEEFEITEGVDNAGTNNSGEE